MDSKRILIVEDDTDISNIIDYNLKKDGYKTKIVANGRDVLKAVKEFEPDLILLDIMLPGIDGIELCKKLKYNEDTQSIPIIMVTAKSDDTDMIVGLELGADDYLTKPFNPKVLVARIKNLLKRSERQDEEPNIINYNNIKIDLDKYEVYCNNQSLHLSKIEFDILVYLCKNVGRVASRNRIMENCWPDGVFVIDRAVDVHIQSLRKKLGDSGELIETVRGVGYCIK